MKPILLIYAGLLMFILPACSQNKGDNQFNYLGQQPVGKVAKQFAPDILPKKGEYAFGSVFNKDVTEFYYAVVVNGKEEIRQSRLIDDQWTMPETILVHDRYGYNDPFLSPDENRLYFISKRALDGVGAIKDYDIWYVDRLAEGWSEPVNVGANINSERNEYYISFTKDGTLYFASNINAPQVQGDDFDIYSSKYVNGIFEKPVRLSDAINTQHYEADVFIDPDESYVIFAANRPDGKGRGDLYISFKKPDGSWTPSKNMGSQINTSGHELCPYVSADKKYFFYTSDGAIYWVSTEIVEELR